MNLAQTRPVLELETLSVAYRRKGGWQEAVRGVSLSILPGETYGLVGESGSGKTTLALAAVRALPANSRVRSGQVRLVGKDLYSLPEKALRKIWGRQVAVVSQNPGSDLNPSIRVGEQLAEILRYQLGMDKRDADQRTAELLHKVRLPDVERIALSYPHQISGGMQQRVAIAMAIAAGPALLLLDEPTTALDVTTQASILDLLAELTASRETASLYITHNLAAAAQICSRIGVLQAGELVEQGQTADIFQNPRHPHTQKLVASHMEPGDRKARSRAQQHNQEGDSRKLVIQDLTVRFVRAVTWRGWLAGSGGAGLEAVKQVSLEIPAGSVYGLVGESGSGKTTLARAVMGLVAPASGRIELGGDPLPVRLENRSKDLLSRLQMVFQDPDEALNPYLTVGESLARPLRLLRGFRPVEARRETHRLLEAVHLPAGYTQRLPGQLSGGEKQRVAIARAFASSPDLLAADEPLSALDVSVQAAILDLFIEMHERTGTSLLFISHDLTVVGYLSDWIAVLYRGELMEFGWAEDLFKLPHHPYTETLLAAIPSLEKNQKAAIPRLENDPPGIDEDLPGCPFHTRCPRYLGSQCAEQRPPWMVDPVSGKAYLCHIPPEQLVRDQHRQPERSR
jgi:peptide/nickel transport system ATP-binding protein